MAASRHPRPLGQASAVLGMLVVAAAASALPPSASGPVRNGAPERPVWQPRTGWPIYYPDLAHAGAATRSAQSTADALRREFLDRHTAMEYEDAAAVAARLQELVPGEAAAHYNRACSLARLCRIDDAMGALRQAIECGWNNRLHLQIDPDLEILRRDPRFTRLLERIPPAALHEPAVTHAAPPAVAFVHRGRVIMQWDDHAHDAPLDAAGLMRIAGETWRLRTANGAVPRPASSSPAPAPVEPLVVLCASPELASELARLIEVSGCTTPIVVRVAAVASACEPGTGPAVAPAARPTPAQPPAGAPRSASRRPAPAPPPPRLAA